MIKESCKSSVHGKKSKTWTLAGVLASVAMMSATASADVKIYSGAECVVLGPDQSNAYYINGRVDNVSTLSEAFYCPVVLDEYALPESTYTWIYLWDRHSTADIHCTLKSQDPVSGSYYFKSTSTSGTSSEPVKKSFTGSTSYSSDNMRYIYCLMPGVYNSYGSSIVAYSVNEG